MDFDDPDPIAALFGESQSRIIVSYAPDDEEKVKAIAESNGVPFRFLGEVVEDRFELGSYITTDVRTIADRYNTVIEEIMASELVGSK